MKPVPIAGTPELTGLVKLAAQATTPWAALSSAPLTNANLQELEQKIEELRARDDHESFCWIPLRDRSFSHFAFDQLESWSGLWFPLHEQGIVLASVKLWQQMQQSGQDPVLEQLVRKWLPVGNSKANEIEFCANEPLPVLQPTQSRCTSEIRNRLKQICSQIPARFPQHRADADAVCAGLYQWYDDLDRSHTYAQSAEHQGRHRAGDYWHQIMHRREGDAWNSKYWCRQTGHHPVHDLMADLAADSDEWKIHAGGNWTPERFVDFCSEAVKKPDAQPIAMQFQAIEMVLLMKQTLKDARG
ncbi:MAG: hypothetical protein KDA78_05470 [Planctomycetaceae bacterium]|nr:hypothetical protein [Planctomycetaceae bacterium]